MIHTNLEEQLPYLLLAVLVMLLFYGIYFGKMLAQRKRGIRTNQIGRRREKTLHTVEMLMKTATYGAPYQDYQKRVSRYLGRK